MVAKADRRALTEASQTAGRAPKPATPLELRDRANQLEQALLRRDGPPSGHAAWLEARVANPATRWDRVDSLVSQTLRGAQAELIKTKRDSVSNEKQLKVDVDVATRAARATLRSIGVKVASNEPADRVLEALKLACAARPVVPTLSGRR